jgi:hypothetical protein
VLERADHLLRDRGQLPLPKGISPHKLRHAFASILVAVGTDPASVMRQIGHRSAAFTLDVYAHMMATSPGQRERVRALVEGERRWGPGPGTPPRRGSLQGADLARPHQRRRHREAADVMARIEAEMSGRFGPTDREIAWGKERWRADVDLACRRLREGGSSNGGPRKGSGG